jgi:cell division transport system permease protein
VRLATREVAIALRQAPLLSALSVVTIAFSLFAFGLFGLVAVNLRRTLDRVEERVEVRAFVAEDTPVERIADAAGAVQKYPEVASVEIVTQDQALERAKKEMGEFSDVFEGSFLPASIELRLKEGQRDPATVKKVADRLRAYDFVDDVRYGEEWVEKLYRLRNIAGAAGAILGLAFAAVAIIIIGATIRMAVLARSREISIMRLVGATDAFIRFPFLIDGFLKGVLGGLLALLFTWTAATVISRYFVETTFFDARYAALGVLFGALMGLMGSAFSVGRHLRRV